jgi:hypothetical protein
MSVPSWSPTKLRKAEAMRDLIMRDVGTGEDWATAIGIVAMHYRKPLRIDEINQMAPTPEVRAREGRG